MAYRNIILGVLIAAALTVASALWWTNQTNLILPLSLEELSSISTPAPLRATRDVPQTRLTIAGTLAETNAHRRQNDLPPLAENRLLARAAKSKLDDMFANQYFEHQSPSGQGPADLARAAGYNFIVIGENLALGNFGTDAALVQAWMDSPGHRANILSANFQEIGIAVGEGTFEGRQTWLAVQEFGTPASACPAAPTPLSDTTSASLTAESNMLVQEKQALEERSQEIKNAQQEIQQLAAEGQALIEQGNAKIKEGNQVYQQTKSREQAQPYWDEGEQLQARGQELLNQANTLQTDVNKQIQEFQQQQISYNAKVDAYNKNQNRTATNIDQYNQQVKTYNACLTSFQK